MIEVKNDNFLDANEEVNERFIPAKFEKKIPTDEIYIAHQLFTFFKKKKKEQRILLLTRRSLYQLNPYDNSLIKKIDLREIYQISEMSGGLSITILLPSFLQKKVKLEGWGAGEASWNMMKKLDFLSDIPEHCFDWNVLLNRITMDRWQCTFEEELKVILGNEIYQECYFVTKVNRYRKLQPRYLLLSNQKMYNVKVGKQGINAKASTWSANIAELLSITIITANDSIFAISMQIDPTSSSVKTKAVSEISFFLLNSLFEQNSMINELKRLYLSLTNRTLQVHTSSEIPLIK